MQPNKDFFGKDWPSIVFSKGKPKEKENKSDESVKKIWNVPKIFRVVASYVLKFHGWKYLTEYRWQNGFQRVGRTKSAKKHFKSKLTLSLNPKAQQISVKNNKTNPIKK